MSSKSLQKAYLQENQQFKSTWSLLEKWAKLEEQFGKSLQIVASKHVALRSASGPFDDLAAHLNEKAESSIGFSEWLRVQILKRFKSEVDALGSFDWTSMNQDTKEDQANQAQLEHAERNVCIEEQQAEAAFEKLERAKLALAENVPKLQVDCASVQLKLRNSRIQLANLRKLYSASHSNFLEGPVQVCHIIVYCFADKMCCRRP
jgi:predicted DNA-binding ribbon-helix-helix protein